MVWTTALGQWRTPMWLALGLAVSASGCFKDSTTGACQSGDELCRCTKEGECGEGLVCEEDNRCRDIDCVDGHEGCACERGTLCLMGLTCLDGTCVVASGGTSTTGSDDSASDPTVVTEASADDPSASDPTMVSETLETTVTTDPSTEVGTSVEEGTTSPGEETAGMDTGPGDVCECGWDSTLGYYTCGFGLPALGPKEFPRDCDPLVVEGMPCDGYTPVVTGPEGCCMVDGNAAWCLANDVVVEVCNDGHMGCAL